MCLPNAKSGGIPIIADYIILAAGKSDPIFEPQPPPKLALVISQEQSNQLTGSKMCLH
jgi:hypothetical protein